MTAGGRRGSKRPAGPGSLLLGDSEPPSRPGFSFERPLPVVDRAPATTDAEVAPHPRQPAPAKDHRHGHRQRLRERFDRSGGEGLPDYELLELLLFRSVPRQDTKPIAKALIARFGSFADALSASPDELGKIDGVGDAVAFDLRLVAAAARRFAKSTVMHRSVLSSWSAVIDYCRTAMAFSEREQFRLLFLDKRNALIADEVQGTGTVDHTPVYPREVVRRALELGASAIILVHNHPSGDPTPSRADIAMTRDIVEAGRHLGVVVHDHLIVGRNGHVSLKAQGFL